MSSMKAINPATGEEVSNFPEHTIQETEHIIQDAHQAFLSWKETSFDERAKCMRKAAQVLRDNKEQYSQLMTAEMGKPIAQSRAETEKCAWVCEFYADHAQKFLERKVIETDFQKSYASYQPLGAVLAIMPWNFPLWQVFRFLAPTLMAGNVGLLKHAENVPGCSIAIEDIMKQAGFPENVFRQLLIRAKETVAVIQHPHVKGVALTGSTRAGKSVAATAGAALKKLVLELGGSDPYIILEDADLDAAVETCVTSRFINSGQSCVAAKRFIVVESLKQAFEEKFVALTQAKKMGDPLEEDTDLGPLARMDLRDELHNQVQASVQKGAKLLLGGEIPDLSGAYYPATVLTDVIPGTPAYDEELFGPVASIISAKDEQDAIRIANDHIYGLGAAVFSKDTAKAEHIAETQIDAGCCFVNDFVKSDPRLPFGGVKESGYGRELASFGIHEFVNVKTVAIK